MTDEEGDAGGRHELVLTALERRDALAALRESPVRKRDLQNELDVSRATAHRIVSTLTEEGLVERTDDGLGLTGVGASVASEIERTTRNVETIQRLAPLIDGIDIERADFDPAAFRDATLIEADSSDPYEVFHRLTEFVLDATEVRMLAEVAGPPRYSEEITDHFVDGAQAEFIVTRAIATDMITQRPRKNLEAFRAGNVAAWLYEDPPCNLVTCDDLVCVAGTGPGTGAPIAAVHTSAEPAQAWADDLFERYREQATSLNPTDYLP